MFFFGFGVIYAQNTNRVSLKILRRKALNGKHRRPPVCDKKFVPQRPAQLI
jgi:hypothetical protein